MWRSDKGSVRENVDFKKLSREVLRSHSSSGLTESSARWMVKRSLMRGVRVRELGSSRVWVGQSEVTDLLLLLIE